MFIVNIEYTAPLEVIDNILAKHRAWLETGYQKGLFLCSGPKNPRTGGVVIAFGSDLQQVKELFQHDPYNIERAANYSFTEFNPVKHHEAIKNIAL